MGQKFRSVWRSFEDWAKSASRNDETNDKFTCINLIPPNKIIPSGILGGSKEACYVIRTLRTVTIPLNSTFLCKKLSNSSGASAFSSILLKLGSYRKLISQIDTNRRIALQRKRVSQDMTWFRPHFCRDSRWLGTCSRPSWI
jgi:hypothetical protein